MVPNDHSNHRQYGVHECQKAVLNTGIHSIFFQLNPDGVLWISPTIPSNRTGVGSVWNTIDYVLHLPEARDGESPTLQRVEIKVKSDKDT